MMGVFLVVRADHKILKQQSIDQKTITFLF